MLATGNSRQDPEVITVRPKTFKATLERLSGKGLKWVIVRLPFDAKRVWGSHGNLKVHVSVNGFEYRTSLFPAREGGQFLLVNKKMQKAAKIAAGSTAVFTVKPDLAPRDVVLPAELKEALSEDRSLRKWFDRLSYSVRKWLTDQVADAKTPETRRRRAERIAEQVMEAMEAEHELPPIMRMVFNRNPAAEKAWRSRTEIQRRQILLSIFHYRDPQSRIRRIEKLAADEEDGGN